MAIESIAAVGASSPGLPVAPVLPAAAPVSAGATGGADFASLLGDGVARVDEGVRAADAQLRALAAGDGGAPHETMIVMEEARMNLMLLVEVRNRVVEAYQELVRMQL